MPWRRRWEWVSASMSRFRASFGFETGGKLSFVFEKLDCLLGSVSSLSFPCLRIEIGTLTTSCRVSVGFLSLQDVLLRKARLEVLALAQRSGYEQPGRCRRALPRHLLTQTSKGCLGQHPAMETEA